MRADRLARLHASVDRHAGEAVTVSPFTEGGYIVGGADPVRPPLTIVAEVTDVPKTVRANGSGSATGHNAEQRTASHTITYATTALPYQLRRGDRVMLDKRGGQTLKVNSVDPFGTARSIAYLEILPLRETA